MANQAKFCEARQPLKVSGLGADGFDDLALDRSRLSKAPKACKPKETKLKDSLSTEEGSPSKQVPELSNDFVDLHCEKEDVEDVSEADIHKQKSELPVEKEEMKQLAPQAMEEVEQIILHDGKEVIILN